MQFDEYKFEIIEIAHKYFYYDGLAVFKRYNIKLVTVG